MKIRHKIFETNSSSSHSFVIYGNETDYETPVIDGPIEIQLGEYGWDYGVLVDWIEKAEYLATYAATVGYKENIKKNTKLFEKVMSEYLKVPVTIAKIPSDDNYLHMCYIDHQSHDVAEKLFENIIETVFRRNLVIYTDNDNH